MTDQPNILIVEDNELDVEKIERCFKRLNLCNPLYVAKNGLEALEFLRGTNGRQKLPSPYVILLDLNMPQMNGVEFLDELRNDEGLKSSLVFVLTTSDRGQDIKDAYRYNVAGYIVKPITYQNMIETLEILSKYWTLNAHPDSKLEIN